MTFYKKREKNKFNSKVVTELTTSSKNHVKNKKICFRNKTIRKQAMNISVAK